MQDCGYFEDDGEYVDTYLLLGDVPNCDAYVDVGAVYDVELLGVLEVKILLYCGIGSSRELSKEELLDLEEPEYLFK